MCAQGQINYEVEEHLGPKFLKVLENTAKVIYFWGKQALVLQKFKSFVNS